MYCLLIYVPERKEKENVNPKRTNIFKTNEKSRETYSLRVDRRLPEKAKHRTARHL